MCHSRLTLNRSVATRWRIRCRTPPGVSNARSLKVGTPAASRPPVERAPVTPGLLSVAVVIRRVRKLLKTWSRRPGLNRRPTDYESVALPLSYVGLRNYQARIIAAFPPGKAPRGGSVVTRNVSPGAAQRPAVCRTVGPRSGLRNENRGHNLVRRAPGLSAAAREAWH